MSRVGRSPIPVPSGVDVTFAGDTVTVKGPQGTLTRTLPEPITVRQEDSTLLVERPNDERQNRALHGLVRSLVNNMVVGVSTGFSKELEIVGVGYRAAAAGPNKLDLALGFSHPVSVDAPDGITFEVPAPTRIIVKGIDKEVVGQVAANIRKIRKPEPYKGKGVRYAGERVLRKAGKGSEVAMSISTKKHAGRLRRHNRIRKKVRGEAGAGPRLAVYRSNKHIVAQVIDDRAGVTLAAASTHEADLRSGATGNKDAATKVGRLVAERAKAAGIDKVVFDRGGYVYHGRIAAVADAAREAGLEL